MEELLATLLTKVTELEKRIDLLENSTAPEEAGEVYLGGMDDSYRRYIEEELKIKVGG